MNTSRMGPKRRIKYAPVILVITVGVGLGLFVFYLLRNLEAQETRIEFERDANNRITSIEQTLEDKMLLLTAMQSAWRVADSVTREQFRDFVQPFLGADPGIQALEWIPRVSMESREIVENLAREDGLLDFSIREIGADGTMTAAAIREEYFPVYFVEPLKNNESALGFDLASNVTRRTALSTAAETGNIVATARITLVQETEQQYGLLLFLPVYERGDSGDRTLEPLRGFVLGVFRITSIIRQALGSLGSQGILVEVIDESAAPGESTLYSDIESGRTGETAIEDDFLVFSKSIDIGQRAWRVSCSSTASYLDMRRSNYPIIMLGVILALTTLLAGYLILNYRRTWKIELLVEERKIAEELATKSLAEKEVLLKETHHRVKNNLQIISSLLNLQSAQIEDEAVQKLFTESKDRVSAMALIHEKLYRSEDLAEVDFGDYLESLIENLSQSYTLPGQPVTIDMAAQDISLDIDTAIPCALIINELVSNGLKHAFPIDAPSGNEENVIQVAMTHEGVNELVLRVSDNGCGFSDGVNFRDTESLGFQIVTTLTEQLDGVIDLNNEDGTTFTLRLNENLENAGV